MIRSLLISLLLLSSMLDNYATARAVSGYDLITMKNGDYHHGTLAQEIFKFTTAYGDLHIPYHLMAQLRIGDQPGSDHLYTRMGDVFTGEVQRTDIVILRSQQALLQQHMSDMAEIIFAPRNVRKKIPVVPDAIELRNGDRFLATIRLNNFLLKTQQGIHAIARDDVHLLEFASLNDGEDLRVQVTFNNGQFHQGQLLAVNEIEVVTRYGDMLKLPLKSLSRLAYQVNHDHAVANFNFRRHIRPGDLIRDQMVDGKPAPELVALRGGDFQRGDLQGGGDTDELPVMKLKPAAFAIGIYEVTFAEYDQFCEDTRRTKPDDSGWGRGQRPVVNISWNDAVAYTQWLSRKTRQVYRLPSDAEWEYAARAGTNTRFWWGNDLLPAYANCAGCDSLWDGEKTSPVGSFPANQFGLHDTAGNVFEWVADCFHSSFAATSSDGQPLDKTGCGKRVIRGGAWSFPPVEVRSANRWRDFPTRKSDDTGFRVVRELRSYQKTAQ